MRVLFVLAVLPTMIAFLHIRTLITKPFYISLDHLNHTRYIPICKCSVDSPPPIIKPVLDPNDKYSNVWNFVDSIDDLFLRLCIFYKYDWKMRIQRTNQEVGELLGCSEYAVKLTLDYIEPTLKSYIPK